MKRYSPKTCTTRLQCGSRPMIRFTKPGTIHFTDMAAAILNIQSGMKIEFWHDDLHPKDWFVSIDSEGFEVRKNKSYFGICCSSVYNAIVDSCKIEKTKFLLLLSKEPTIVDGIVMHAIITSKIN
jgi:hypothetical protein